MSDSIKDTYVFEKAPVLKAIAILGIPTVITQLINIIYNYADTWFVGRTGNPAMVASMSVTMPIFVIMAALANLFGIGGSSVISRNLGEKNPERARKVFAFCLYGGLASAVLYAILMFFIRPWLIPVIGGDKNSYPYAYSYIFWTMVIGAIPTVGNVLCGHLIRSIGAAKEAGFGMSLGGVLNIALDPLFMFVILPSGMEVTGAAIATMLSNTASLIYFIIFLFRHRDNPIFTMNPRDISLEDHIPGDVLAVGFPAALQTTLAMVSNIFANALVKPYGSEAVAGMGVSKKINMIAFNTTMGLTQGILPLIGYCYGARNFKRLRETIRKTGIIAVIFGCICTVLFRIFASPMCRFFIDEDLSVSYGSTFLKTIAFAAPLAAICYLYNTLFQATGRKVQSFLLSTLRKGFLDVPGMFIFGSFLGAFGVVLATPVAEVISTALAVILYVRFLHSLKASDNLQQS
ncbi:MAG: MATE family efflux transporter [Eubacterium sp.]|nr:MATE family efflux transporter [Eubacterium sp.]